MQQIAEWLEELGMSEYAQRFTENGISVAAFRHLTDQDLKGHRRPPRASADNAGGYRTPFWRTTGSAKTSRCSRAEGARYRRATAGHGHVLGPCWFDCTRGAYGP